MPRFLIPVVAAVLFVALACGADSSSQQDSGATDGADPERAMTVFERLLALVPDTPDSRKAVRMNDIRRAQIAQGIASPGPDATPEDILQFKQDVAFGTERPAVFILQLGDGWISGYQRDYGPVANDTKSSLGFDARDIEASVLLGEANQPPQPLSEIVLGEFDASLAPDLLAACEECPPHRFASYQGQEYFTWDGPEAHSLRNRELPPSFDRIGRGGHIVVADDYVFRTLEVPDLERLIDTASASAGNLSNDPQYRAVARLLAEEGAVSAVLTDQSFDVETVIQAIGGESAFEGQEESGQVAPGTVDRIRTAVAESGPLEPFEVLGVGLGRDEAGAFALVALGYADAETAADAASQLRERMEVGHYPDFKGDGEIDTFLDRISEFEITSVGPVTLGKFRTAEPSGLRAFSMGAFSSSLLFNNFGYMIAFE